MAVCDQGNVEKDWTYMTNAVRNHSAAPATLTDVSIPHGQNFTIVDAFIAAGPKVYRHGPWPGYPATDKEVAANIAIYKPLKGYLIPATKTDDLDDPDTKYWVALHLRFTDTKQRTASSGTIRIEYTSDGETYVINEDNMAFNVNPVCPPAPWKTATGQAPAAVDEQAGEPAY